MMSGRLHLNAWHHQPQTDFYLYTHMRHGIKGCTSSSFHRQETESYCRTLRLHAIVIGVAYRPMRLNEGGRSAAWRVGIDKVN